VSFEELVGLCVTFTVPDGSPDNYQVTLTYFDVDEDTITIASTDELIDAIEQFSKAKVLRVATEVKAAPSAARPPAGVPVADRTRHGASPAAQDPIHPQVHNVLKSFVGILSTAVNHLQEGLATSPHAEPHQSGPAFAGRAPKPSPEPAPNATPSASSETGHPMGAPEVIPFIHYRHTCDGCRSSPIMGKRFRAINHPDFDLCEKCFSTFDATGLTFEETELEGDRIRQPAWQAAHRIEKRQAEAAKEEPPKEDTNEPEGSAPFIHGRHTCDSCLTTPIVGKRFHAVNLPDYDLCESCHSSYTGTAVRFLETELERDRPFQSRWHRRREKLERFKNRQVRLTTARSRFANNCARGPPGRFAKSSVEPTGRRCEGGTNCVPAYSPCVPFQRPTTDTNSGPTSVPTVPIRGGESEGTIASSSSSSHRTHEFDDALKEAIRRSLRDISPNFKGVLNQESEISEASPRTTTLNDEAQANEVMEGATSGIPEEPDIVVEPEEAHDGGLSPEDTKAMEDAMETASVDSEKLLAESETMNRKSTGNTHFSNDTSFQSEAAGSGEVAEAVGATLDLVAGMISDMLSEADSKPSPEESMEDTSKPLIDDQESPSAPGAIIVEQTSAEESEWQVVGQYGEDELNMPDEEIARAAEMLGSALFNSSTREAEEPNSPGSMSNLSDSFSVPSIVASINVGDSQRARWNTQLEKLQELGFDDESKIVEILERLQAANIGVDSEDDISVTQVVNMILEDK
jgi:hypothetical protein